MPTYGERDLAFARGKGCYLYTTSGKKYLDFAGGIAVNSLGHCHPQLVKILKKQSKILWHTHQIYIKIIIKNYLLKNFVIKHLQIKFFLQILVLKQLNVV